MCVLLRRSLACLLAVIICVMQLPILSAADTESDQAPITDATESSNSFNINDRIPYSQYIQNFTNFSQTDEQEVVVVDLNTFTADDDSVAFSTLSDNTTMLATPSPGDVTFSFHVKKSGFYRLKVGYYPMAGSGSAIIRSVAVDGEVPFYEASVTEFPRVWADQKPNPSKDDIGNDILPMQVETPRVETTYLHNSGGLSNEDLYFYLTEGDHTLTFSGVREPLGLTALAWETAPKVPTYAQVVEDYTNNGYTKIDKSFLLQGEDVTAKSDATLYPLNDKTSPNTNPKSDRYIRYNSIGGSKWQQCGQWLEWSFTVPETGLYTIALRYKQNLKANSTVYRRLTLDGTVPFAEAEAIEFAYTSGYKPFVLGDEENGDYAFFFTAGETHTLRLEAITGVFASVLSDAQQLVNELNQVYREILMITGPSPDLYRDYDFPDLIPQTLAHMETIRTDLDALVKAIQDITGWESSSELSSIQRVIGTLDEMIEDDTTIAARFSYFQDNISGLATWVLDTKAQPLEIDYFVVGGKEENIEENGGFFEIIAYQAVQFFYSFLTDYSRLGQVGGNQEESITVWLQTGRDQSQIIRGLINQDFTPNEKIGVQLQLVAAGSLLPAIVAGLGPDVSLQLGQGDPMNYAFRNAVADLSQMPGIEEVKKRFDEQALIPFQYEDHLYALPESQSFQMLFYRMDILADLGITPDDLTTWDRIFKVVIPELQKNYLDFGLTPSLANYALLLYQNGGAVYSDDGKRSELSSAASVEIFDTFTKLYTEYLQPVAFDFANRFRTGQMPLAVVDLSAYNQLSVFAPEINGLWGMSPVPGTVQEDGTLDRTSILGISSCVMFSYSENKDAAWKFMKWWTDAPVQMQYGKNMESIMGTAARYNSANKEAFASVSWSADVRQAIDEQMLSVRPIPEVPGGYYTSRYFDFAYRDVVNDGKEVRPTLNESVKQINAEIANKREEFGLD